MPYKNVEDKRRAQREYTRRNRDAYFTGKVCAHCGSDGKLVLDHIDWRTKVHHNVWSWAPARRAAELAKCQPLCIPCHKEKTWGKDLPEQGYCTPSDGTSHHGTWGRYRRGCRCGLCRLKNINYHRSRKVNEAAG